MITQVTSRRASVAALMGAVLAASVAGAATASATGQTATRSAGCVTQWDEGASSAAFTAGDVTLSRSAIAVSGLNTVPVTVTARAGWNGAPRPTYGSTCILVTLTRTSATSPTDQQPWPNRYVLLHLVSGTPTRGLYSGTTFIPSTLGGTLKATSVSAEPRLGDEYGTPVSVAVNGPVLTVRGVHVPRFVSVASRSAGVAAGVRRHTVSGKVVDSATGRGYASAVPVSVCSGDMGSYRRVLSNTTAAKGTGRFSATVRDDGFGACATLVPKGVGDDGEGFQRIATVVKS